jgi:hypothetical protein
VERTILIVFLFACSLAYFSKMVVFGVLSYEMRPVDDEHPLGTAIFRHYLSISVQSFFLTILFGYYGQQFIWGAWPYRTRIALYLLTFTTIVWVIISGIGMLRTYFVVKDTTDQLKQEVGEQKVQIDTHEIEIGKGGMVAKVEKAAERTEVAAERIEHVADDLAEKGDTT